MTAIAAIETRYAGCRFRSRLEARWAVFFDALGIAWEYEPQGFHIPPSPFGGDDLQHPGWNYLPDFYLPARRRCPGGAALEAYGRGWGTRVAESEPRWTGDQGLWVEVKGDPYGLNGDYGVMLNNAIDCGPLKDTGLLILGSIPRLTDRVSQVFHPYLYYAKGTNIGHVEFHSFGVTRNQSAGLVRPFPYYLGSDPNDGLPDALTTDAFEMCISRLDGSYWTLDDEVAAAYAAARSARFEHGENG